MSLIFPDFYTTPAEIKAAFDSARDEGKSHLLILNTTCNDYYAIRDGLSFHGVDKPEDIVGVLRERNKGRGQDDRVSLVKTFDTSKDFDFQNTFSQAAGPLAPAFYFIDPLVAERIQADIKYLVEMEQYEQKLYEYEGRPVLRKILDNVLRIDSAPVLPKPEARGGPRLHI